MTQILVPVLGESVTEATVAQWLKKEGDSVKADEPVVELETDKVTLEVGAPADGVMGKIIVAAGQNVGVGAVLGELNVGAAANDVKPAAKPAEQPKAAPASASGDVKQSPAVRKMIGDHDIDARDITVSGKNNRITKEDVQNYVEERSAPTPKESKALDKAKAPRETGVREERVRMTRLRQRVAERLKDAQNTAAILTTFNEVDMGAVMDLRNEYKDVFEKKHGVKLGFMSFFVRAAIQALKEFPSVNAEIDGEDIIYKNYYDIGVAVSTPQGLIVPVLRDADELNMAQIEKAIVDLGTRAREGKLKMEEMVGGTFTITNGGVFGSLLSTPILNTPQSGILGMHKIQQRPMVTKDGRIEARPMMYLAHSYDHRIIDGREAVSFLVRVKDAIEDPQRLLLHI
ncbi:MAG: 2-oxoglutarate dehydrogenase complex dihydrolipoyllysine-residue succinyltransferase [Alphaproteobacteria bacterium]